MTNSNTIDATMDILSADGEVFTLRSSDGMELRLTSIPRSTILYLLQNGFAGTMTDCVAGISAKYVGDLKPAKRDELCVELDLLKSIGDQDLANEWIAAKRNARFAKLVAGTMEPATIRARASAEEKEALAIAEAVVKGALDDAKGMINGKKVTAEERDALAKDYLEANRADIMAEVAERAARSARMKGGLKF